MAAKRPKYLPVNDEPAVELQSDTAPNNVDVAESDLDQDTKSEANSDQEDESDVKYANPEDEAHLRQTWPIGYGLFAGVLAAFIGAGAVMMMGNPFIYIVATVAAIVLLWFVWWSGGRFSELIKGASIGHSSLIWAGLTLIVGLVAWLLAPVFGPILMATNGITWVHALALFFGTSVLIIGVADRKKWLAICGLVAFAAIVMIGSHVSELERQHQQNQQEHFQQERENQKKLDDTCSSEDAELYPEECGG